MPKGEHVRAESVDVADTAALTEVLRGVNTAYYLAHAMAGGGDFADRDRRMARSFAEAAAAAGVRRIVYLGGLGAGKLSKHLESRQEVGRLLAETGVEVVELRAAVIIGAGSISFEMLRYLTERLPAMVCPRWVGTRVQPIAEADLMAYLRAAAEESVPAGVHEIGGPDVLTYEELMQLYASVRGLPRRRIVRVPLLSPGLSAHWVGVVTPVDRTVSRSLIDSLTTDVVVTEPTTAFDIDPVPVAAAIQSTMDNQRERIAERVFDFENGLLDGVFALSTKVPVEPGDASGARLDLRKCGGSLRWYGWAWAWWLRIVLGRLFGERLSLHRPAKVERGARVDWWTVAEFSDHHIVLMTDKWFCGEAWLGYRIGASGLEQVGALRSRGLLGWVYWRAVYPIHLVVFRVMARKQVTRAHALAREAAARQSG
ncbi:NAD-dependent dehydratase [Actinokineospora sp. NBRC 105648]|nr:NAD-dependent dehydratase [Actinokineospora sp. NBRC 105648]